MASKYTFMRASGGFMIRTESPEHRDSFTAIKPRIEGERQYREWCAERVRAILQPGDTVLCVIRSVSRSGMSRVISFFPEKDTAISLDNYMIALGIGSDHRNGVKIGGCGMDMGFAAVYKLGSALWPRGTDKPHGTRNGEPDTCGGYALKHRWL